MIKLEIISFLLNSSKAIWPQNLVTFFPISHIATNRCPQTFYTSCFDGVNLRSFRGCVGPWKWVEDLGGSYHWQDHTPPSPGLVWSLSQDFPKPSLPSSRFLFRCRLGELEVYMWCLKAHDRETLEAPNHTIASGPVSQKLCYRYLWATRGWTWEVRVSEESRWE